MLTDHLLDEADQTIAITVVDVEGFAGWLEARPELEGWFESHRFEARAGRHLVLPSAEGPAAERPGGVVLVRGRTATLWDFAGLPQALPAGTYRLENPHDFATAAALGWALGCYAFARYRPAKRRPADLVWPEGADRAAVQSAAAATEIVRDLVNTPAADLGPAELEALVGEMAGRHGATFRTTIGSELLDAGFPMIHAVGRASDRAPRLLDLCWGNEAAPRVTLVGKGVCFDSGGLDLKPAEAMALMKKDMGGAAVMLGLAGMIMEAGLDLRLRLLIPAVDNSVSAQSLRPGDVLQSRKGLSVEIGNTDAEGRLVLADAITEADAEAPELLLDAATLTGAARTALGPEIAALYCDDDELAADLVRQAEVQADPLWRLPLWAPYGRLIESRIADLNNAGEERMAGSITAALFLKRFVSQARAWAHLDLYAWNKRARPGRPVGGEAQTMRTLFAVIAQRYSLA